MDKFTSQIILGELPVASDCFSGLNLQFDYTLEYNETVI